MKKIKVEGIVFDNLVEIIPEYSNVKNNLYRPTSLEDVSQRAMKAGARFVELFQTKKD